MNKLWLRLALSFLMITVLAIGAMALVVRHSVATSFDAYITISNTARFGNDFVAELEAYYATQNSWAGVAERLPARGGGQGNASENNASSNTGNNAGSTRGVQVFIAETGGTIIASTQDDWVGASLASIGQSRQINLRVDGVIVGILGEQTPGTVAINEAENRFLQETTTGMVSMGIIAGMLALTLGIALSYSLTRPLQRLTRHMSQWHPNDAPPTMPPIGTDEIRQLHTAFTDLLARLAEIETQRQHMSADVAHELRTPVTIMRGHLEAMMDGVYPLDAEHLAVAYDQVLHLARLVEDLRLLTQAEANQVPLSPTQFDLHTHITATLTRFAPLAQDHQVHMVTALQATTTTVYADPHRIQQVLDNLLSNALRHTPAGATIRIHTRNTLHSIETRISNPAPDSLSDAHIHHLFDRFWRAQDARDRDRGGSGLGLAITRELLRMQGGTIYAQRDGVDLMLIVTLENPL